MRSYDICQVAYHARDIRASALRHSKLFGSGPFFVMEHIPFGRVVYRDKVIQFDHSAAFGQWGDVMVEFVHSDEAGPSILNELPLAAGQDIRLHHVASMVENLNDAVRTFQSQGINEIFRATIPDMGMEGVFLDALADTGHFIELYEPAPQLVGFYDAIKKAALNFDGRSPVRDTAELA